MAGVKTGRSGIPLIAELAGVSIGTVDRALHDRPGINAETRDRVLAVAKPQSGCPFALHGSADPDRCMRPAGNSLFLQ